MTSPTRTSIPPAPVDPATGFDLDGAWEIHPSVSIRPEPFGALLYHFGNRRLSFLKSRQLLAVVEGLADAPDARAACRAAGGTDAQLPGLAKALGSLAAGDAIRPRTAGAIHATPADQEDV